MPPLQAFTAYNASMAKSIMDKLFFVDKIEPDAIVDYGCADGTILEACRQWLPDTKAFLGYDLNKDMITAAHKTIELPYEGERYKFLSTNWDDIMEKLRSSGAKTPALLLNSVIHEVFHYSPVEELELFWKRTFESGFKYVVIRDMIPSMSIDRPSLISDVTKVYHKFFGSYELRDFESIWGSIENNRNLHHFLLKYRYTDNWAREVRENYIPLSREELLAKTPNEYGVVYHEHYISPWINRQVNKDLGMGFRDPTHLKILLERD